jgi:hypothetical protein
VAHTRDGASYNVLEDLDILQELGLSATKHLGSFMDTCLAMFVLGSHMELSIKAHADAEKTMETNQNY